MNTPKISLELTPGQQKDLVVALMTGVPGRVNSDMVKLTSYNPAYVLMGTEHHSIRYVMPVFGKDYSYLLHISHFNRDTQRNPETITLFRLGGGESPERWDLRGLGYVTDRLREYGIWEEVADEKKGRSLNNASVTDIEFKEIAMSQLNIRLSESGLSGGLLDGVRCTDAFDRLVMTTKNLGNAIVLFDAVLDQAKSLCKPASWVVDELDFEIHVQGTDPGRREALARLILEQAGNVGDQLLDQYNERLTRFRYGKEE